MGRSSALRIGLTLGAVAFALALPQWIRSDYMIHILTLMLLWSFVATGWAYMARFGLVSLGHGVFLGIGAYVPALLFNYYGLSPWLGMLVGVAVAVAVAALLGYACFRSGLIGDYFALVTLAVAEVASLTIVAFREVTGGSLGLTLRTSGHSWWYLQFDDKRYFYYIILVFLLLALVLWRRIDRSRMRMALTAIGEDELAASSLGVTVLKFKMAITMISAALTAVGGVLYCQYLTYINPHTVSGVGVSLAICFKAILGGMFALLGPLVGASLIVSLQEYVRVSLGTKFLGISEVVYGLVLILLIIFLPKGIFGSLNAAWQGRIQKGGPTA